MIGTYRGGNDVVRDGVPTPKFTPTYITQNDYSSWVVPAGKTSFTLWITQVWPVVKERGQVQTIVRNAILVYIACLGLRHKPKMNPSNALWMNACFGSLTSDSSTGGKVPQPAQVITRGMQESLPHGLRTSSQLTELLMCPTTPFFYCVRALPGLCSKLAPSATVIPN